MEKPDKPGKRSFWDKVEAVADTMEIGIRLVWALIMASVFVGLAWWLGSKVWMGLAIFLAVPAFATGFLTGFFWPEVKLLGGMILRSFINPF